MSPERFLENFDLLAELPNAVPKLRELILELAVRGRLVEQDPEDEPAMRVVAELVKQKSEAPIYSEHPYELPQGWCWTRIGAISSVKGGKRLPAGASFSSRVTPWIYLQVTNMKNGSIVENELKYIDEITHKAIKRYIIEKDDLYITIAGTIGQIGSIPEHMHGMHLTENAARIIFGGFSRRYFELALNSKFVQDQFRDSTKQLAQPKLALKRIADAYFPFPPINEQCRIVTKVDQLLALCDELDRCYELRREGRVRLRNAMLDSLALVSSAVEFKFRWKSIKGSFALLFDTPESVGKLRQTVLQLAVQGRLVSQDTDDEPGDVLVERIRLERMRLLGESKCKVSRVTETANPKHGPFAIPDRWVWATIEDIASYVQRGKSPIYADESDFPVVSQKCVQWDGFKIDRARFVTASSIDKYEEMRFLRHGDLLWNSTGIGTVGRACLYDSNIHKYQMVVADSHVTVIRPLLINAKYLYYWIAGPHIQGMINSLATGSTKQTELSTGTIKSQAIPLPPLAEQCRIVAEVDELMALCDDLEAKLKRVEEDGERLMESVVRSVTALESASEGTGGAVVPAPVTPKKNGQSSSHSKTSVQDMLPFA